MLKSESKDTVKIENLHSSPQSQGKKSVEVHEKYNKPTPLDFDTFIPWVFTQWQTPEPIYIKISREEHVVHHGKDKTKPRSSRSLKSTKSKHSSERTSPLSSPFSQKLINKLIDFVPVTTYYESSLLTEIAINNCRCKIHKKIMQAFSLCAPFHPSLTRLTIRNSPLTAPLLCEMSKFLFHSNITDICLDYTYVPEGNYYVLLEELTQLRYLSLNRCRIDDVVCQLIALRLDYEYPATCSLQILDLGSNVITDKGARAIGEMLRRNRRLLHINLSGNDITDEGMGFIMNSLMEFPLTYDEILQMKRARLRYIENKTAVYSRCLEEMLHRAIEPVRSLSSLGFSTPLSKNKIVKKHRKSIYSQPVEDLNIEEVAERMTNDIVGDFKGHYGPAGVVTRHGYYYGKGNFTLCSINFAYNNLGFPSIKKIYKVLAYQYDMCLKHPDTGLMRVGLDGNYLPETCYELDCIDMYLRRNVNVNTPVVTSPTTHKRKLSHVKKHAKIESPV